MIPVGILPVKKQRAARAKLRAIMAIPEMIIIFPANLFIDTVLSIADAANQAYDIHYLWIKKK